MRSHADLVARVPLRTYEEFAPYLLRMQKGERDVLWPGLVRYFARSGGTSQRGVTWKYLPISHEQLRWQGRQAFDILARYLSQSGDRRFTGGFSPRAAAAADDHLAGTDWLCLQPQSHAKDDAGAVSYAVPAASGDS